MKNSIIFRLKRYFLLSTVIPFFLIVIITSTIITQNDKNDIAVVTEGYMNSIAQNIDGYFNDLRKIAILPYFSQEIMNGIKILSDGEDSYSLRLDLESQLNSLLSSVRYTSNDFYSAVIVKDDTVLYSSHNGLDVVTIPGYSFSVTDWYQNAMTSDSTMIFLPPHTVDYYLPNDTKTRISILTTIRNLYSRIPYAVLKIDILPSTFDKYLQDVQFHLPSCVYITDTENRLIYSSGKSEEMLDRLNTTTLDGIITGIPDHSILFSKDIPHTVYTLHIAIDKLTMYRKTVRLYAIGFLLYLLAVVIAFTLYNRTSSRISKPIDELKRVLEEVSQGNFKARYKNDSNWELQEIGSIVNQMIEDLESLINLTYIAQMDKIQAENRALMAQIKPHFLFNTLNSIISLIYDNQIDNATSCLFSLSNLLHYVLRMDNTVLLKDEVCFLKDYLTLQKTRFNNRFEWSIEIDSSTEDCLIPRLLLQPFIENSIVHGIEPTERLCHVNLTSYPSDAGLTIEIKDDGAGFDRTKTDISKSIGISNSISRLKLLYEQSSVAISSALGDGCLVRIEITGDINENLVCR